MTFALRHNHLIGNFHEAREAVLRAIGRDKEPWIGHRGVDGGDVFLIMGNPNKDGAPGYVVNKTTSHVNVDRDDMETVHRIWKNPNRVVISF